MLILEKLWNGEISPWERAVQENSEYEALSHRTAELQSMIYKELSAEGRAVFDEYNDKEEQLADISEQDAFIKGVQIGARLVLDILGDYPSQLPQKSEQTNH